MFESKDADSALVGIYAVTYNVWRTSFKRIRLKLKIDVVVGDAEVEPNCVPSALNNFTFEKSAESAFGVPSSVGAAFSYKLTVTEERVIFSPPAVKSTLTNLCPAVPGTTSLAIGFVVLATIV